MDVSRGYTFTLLGDTPARFAIRLFIIMGMSDGVERGKSVKPYDELRQCWHANSANKICKTRIPFEFTWGIHFFECYQIEKL